MFKNILVAIDGSQTAEKGLDAAISLAREQGAGLTILHVLDMYLATADLLTAGPRASHAEHVQQMRRSGEQMLARAAARAEQAGVHASTNLCESAARAADAIAAEARKGFDLLVLGTHGRRGVGRILLGSDAEQVVRISPIPVLLVRSDQAVAG